MLQTSKRWSKYNLHAVNHNKSVVLYIYITINLFIIHVAFNVCIPYVQICILFLLLFKFTFQSTHTRMRDNILQLN